MRRLLALIPILASLHFIELKHQIVMDVAAGDLIRSVSKMPHASKDHGQSQAIRCVNHFLVAH
jgi:hypothetical protein